MVLLTAEFNQHILQSILQGKIPGKRGIGRIKIFWLGHLRNWTTKSTTKLFRETLSGESTTKIPGWLPTSKTGKDQKKKVK